MVSVGNGEAPAFEPGLRRAALALGFAAGGFFDGILLHQILQWHHLLSALDDPAFGDIRVQILADGLFHALMYVVGAAGIFLLWRARHGLERPGAGRLLAAGALVGFGAWHILDAVLSHWVLGIHRIRMDTGNRLLWDLIWFFVFGVAFVLAGWWARPRGGPGAGRHAPESRRAGRVAASVLALAVLAGGPVSALPPRDAGGTALALFRPDMAARDVLAAVAAAGGRTVWSDPSGGLWAVDFDEPGAARSLYGRGALLVGGSLLPAGCLAWSRTS